MFMFASARDNKTKEDALEKTYTTETNTTNDWVIMDPQL